MTDFYQYFNTVQLLCHIKSLFQTLRSSANVGVEWIYLNFYNGDVFECKRGCRV